MRDRSKASGPSARFRRVVRAFGGQLEEDGGSKRFGANALKHDGKMFAMEVDGRLVVKLSKSRADELVEKRLAKFFDPGHGRLMKQWVVLLDDDQSWAALAKEAHDFARSKG
jgi:TfoX/Sxy family transcriptional regulator of competence genes